MGLKDTIGNEKWLRDNETKIKDILPETFTHVNNLNGLGIGYKLKLIGIDWRSEDEFGKIMAYLEKVGIMLRDGLTIKRNIHSIFNQDR